MTANEDAGGAVQMTERAILSASGARIGEAVARLAPGTAWSALLPGAEPAAVVRALGGEAAAEGAIASAALAVEAAIGSVEMASNLGIPFELEGPIDAAALARAVIASALAAPTISPTGGAEHEVVPPSRAEVESAVRACLDHASEVCLSGAALDPLDALVACPGYDLRPMVGMADREARLRFVEAMADARSAPPADARAAFASSYFLRSAAAGLVATVRRALAAPSWAEEGRDEEGWPTWWRIRAADEVAARAELPPAARTPPETADAGNSEDRGFVLLVAPREAAALLRRDWPEDIWLAVARAPDGAFRWEAGRELALPSLACGRPAWPPVPGLPEAHVSAEWEAALLRWVACHSAEITPPDQADDEGTGAGIGTADVSWDD